MITQQPHDVPGAAVGQTQRDAYWHFVESSPQGIFYCHRWWLDAVCPGEYEILSVEENGKCVAVWPIVWRKFLGFRCIGMPRLTQKLGILFAPSDARYADRLSDEHRIIRSLLDQLPAGTVITGHHFHEAFENWLPFHWAGFQQTTRYTYILDDISDPDAVWQGLQRSARKNIRKAERAGLRIRETEDLEEFYRIQCMTFKRQSMRNPTPLAIVERIYEACKANAGVRITIAEDAQRRPHAAVFMPYDSRCMVDLIGGGDPELRGSGLSGTLVCWDAIRFASTVCRRFDFEGSMIQSIEQFIRRFGGRQTPYFRITGVLRAKPTSHFRRRAGELLRRVGNVLG